MIAVRKTSHFLAEDAFLFLLCLIYHKIEIQRNSHLPLFKVKMWTEWVKCSKVLLIGSLDVPSTSYIEGKVGKWKLKELTSIQ
ncbi:hypothetical protein AU385_11020 [Bacillus halotolerans]|nr:hypothetical protein AU385_11020 [Bacillus halotolerans]KUP36895.1 hypothetical protein AU384_05745 [Bacillus halotolerans]